MRFRFSGFRFQLALAAVAAGLLAVAVAQDAAPQSPSPAQEFSIRCEVCGGQGQAVFKPSERLVKMAGSGGIGTKSRFAKKVKCPVCSGRGRRTVRPVKDVPPQDDVPPCKKCGWNGFTVCAKCAGEGLAPCKSRRCENGWVYTKREKGGNGQMVGPTLELCPDCGGAAKVPCQKCRGERSIVCPRCHGAGRDLTKTRTRHTREGK